MKNAPEMASEVSARCAFYIAKELVRHGCGVTEALIVAKQVRQHCWRQPDILQLFILRVQDDDGCKHLVAAQMIPAGGARLLYTVDMRALRDRARAWIAREEADTTPTTYPAPFGGRMVTKENA